MADKKTSALWVLYLFFIILAIAFIVLMFIFAWPVNNIAQVPDGLALQQIYNNGNVLNVDMPVVPFLISAPQNQVGQSAATFSSSSGSTLVLGAGNVCLANLFQIQTGRSLQVVALQYAADFVTPLPELGGNQGTERTIAMFNLDTQQLLVQRNVTGLDPLDEGFYTLRLTPTEFVVLMPFTNYAICALVHGSQDRTFQQPNSVQPLNFIMLKGRLEFKSDLMPPNLPPASEFNTQITNNIAFASFQTQIFSTGPTIAFDVDTVNGFGRFPPEYLYNLNCNVQTETLVGVDPGVCTDSLNQSNMVMNAPLLINVLQTGVPNGLDQGPLKVSSWYAVFVLYSTAQGLFPAAMMSLNRQIPSLVPSGYDVVRRVGWVRTNSTAQLIRTTQTGNGPRRRTFYVQEQEIFKREFTAAEILAGTTFNLPLDLVAPLATSVLLFFTATNPNPLPASLFVVPPQTIDVVPLGAFPTNASNIQVTLPIASNPTPYFFNLGLSGDYSHGEADVFVRCVVQAFYDAV